MSTTCAKFAQVRQEGKRKINRNVLQYNLDAMATVRKFRTVRQGREIHPIKAEYVQVQTINRERSKLIIFNKASISES